MNVGDFDEIQPGETDNFSFEFTDDLASDETLSSATFACSVKETYAGITADASPSSRLSGSASVPTSTDDVGVTHYYATQKVTGMLDGNRYILQATAITSTGRTLQRYGYVWSRVAR